MQRILIALPLALVVASGLAAAQQRADQPRQEPPRFRVEINYVEIDAVVTDAQGSPVADLTREDFEVLEDGKPQEITAFSRVDVPIERADAPLLAPTVVPDVASNEREFNGRIYLIILDDLHTAPLRSTRVRLAARQFIERYLGANDLAAIVHTSGRSDAAQEFTNRKALLLAAVDKFLGQKPRSATLERLEEYNRLRGTPMASDPVRDPYEFERAAKARSTLGTLENAAKWMGNIRGRRKAVVMFGEGIDYDINNVFDAQFASTIRDEIRDAIGAATRANVTFYTVDPRGLTVQGDEGIELTAPPEDPSLRLDSRGLQEELRLSQDSLRTLADQTGGLALVNANDFRDGFERIQRENSAYYLLGYYSTNERRDGKYRKLTVRVKRPGLQVRARKGYVAARGNDRRAENDRKSGVDPELAEALNSPVPVSGLPMRLSAAAFKGVAPDASVLLTVEFGAGGIPLEARNGAFQNKVEFTAVAFDQGGKARSAPPATLELNLSEATRNAVVARGFRMLQRIALPPGRYTLRVGAREQNGGALGTVSHDLTVPEFYKAPLSMSGVVITSRAAPGKPTAQADAEIKELLGSVPTSTREFLSADTLTAFAEVYDTQGRSPHKVDITASVKQDGGRTVFSQTEERGTEELQGARGGFGYRVDIPLADMQPGDYVLTVEARSRLSGNPTVRQDVPFRVRGSR